MAPMLSLEAPYSASYVAPKRGNSRRLTLPPPPPAGPAAGCGLDVEPESPCEVFKGSELRNKTLGLVGYGNIGRRVARIARGVRHGGVGGGSVRRRRGYHRAGQKTTLEALFREADIVSLGT